MERKFLVSLPRKYVGKSSGRSVIFDKSHKSLQWHTPDPRISPMILMGYSHLLDSYYPIKNKFSEVMCTPEVLLVSTDDPCRVYEEFQSYVQIEVPLEAQYVRQYTEVIRPCLKQEVVDLLNDLVEYCQVAITVTSNLILNIYGAKPNVTYCQQKLFVLLNHVYGYSVTDMELELSKQQLVAGPDRQNLLTLFQQTGVNVYMPPAIDIPPAVDVNRIYLAGEKVQLLVAEKLLNDVVIKKTDCLEKECLIGSFVRDVLLLRFTQEVEEIMAHFGTFIQLPRSGNIVRVLGTTRRSIDCSISEFMKLCGSIYCMEIQAHFDSNLKAQIGVTGINSYSSENGTVIYGTLDQIKPALDILESADTNGVKMSILIEQPLELMEFILGKKQGKVMKVMNSTGTEITSEKWHEYNFRIRLRGFTIPTLKNALELLLQELPAEKSLYIPEVYHKQVIGQGGLAIQQLMRKYNVYMRFANTTKEKYPNAFCDSRSENVIIRCPAKNQSQIDSAATELLQHVKSLAKEHHRSYVKLSRNHRRLLLTTESNALREIEVTSGAAIALPPDESRDFQFIEISGQTPASTQKAATMLGQLLSQTDYEFRIPWCSQFSQAVGTQSDFHEKVSVPLFLSMNAQTQCFEKVQMVGDPAVYSQVVVSLREDIYGNSFDGVSHVVTSFLRMHNLDIVDKGFLNTELQIEPNVDSILTSVSNPNDDNNNTASKSTKDTPPDPLERPHIRTLYCSPQQSEVSSFITAFPSGSQQADMSSTMISSPQLSSISTFAKPGSNTSPSMEASLRISTRPPMASVLWNRNYDETPLKKRKDFERSHKVTVNQRAMPRASINRIQRLP